MNRMLVLKTTILVAGVIGLAIAVKETISDAHGRVLPSPGALAIGGVLAVVTITCACRTWTALFDDVLEPGRDRHRLRATYYLSQLTKYVPAAGGFVQVGSQVSMAAATGVPIGRVAMAFPTSAFSSVAAGSALGAGLVFASALPVWARLLALCGLAVPVLLNRRLLARFFGLARRFVKRIPASEKLPSQRSMIISFGWALLTLSAAGISYAVLVRSLASGANPATLFSAYALAWVIGFVAIPIPAGIGVREVVVIAVVPGVNKGVLIAASLALRFLALGAELSAVGVNRLLTRYHKAPEPPRDAEPAPAATAGDAEQLSDS